MADSDQSSYITRFDVLSQGMQYFVGSTWYDVPSASSGVSTLNTLTGDVVLAAGTNITLTPSGNTITIDAAGGGGTPGAPDTSIQFNDTGSFAGNAALTWLASDQGLILNGHMEINDPGTGGYNNYPTLDFNGVLPGDNKGSVFLDYAAKNFFVAGESDSSLILQSGAGGIQLGTSDGILMCVGQAVLSQPDASVLVEIRSTTQGFLPPVMDSTARDAIMSPVEGLTIYNTTTHTLNFYNGSAWTAV